MSDPMTLALVALRDVEGVRGSFLLARDGQLLARDLPAVVDNGTLSEAATRVARLHEALVLDDDALEACVLRFSEHRMHLRSVGAGYLAVLSDVKVNMPTLRMALTLVTRRLNGAVEQAFSSQSMRPSTPPITARSPEVYLTPPPPTPTAEDRGGEHSSRRPVMYRGRRIS